MDAPRNEESEPGANGSPWDLLGDPNDKIVRLIRNAWDAGDFERAKKIAIARAGRTLGLIAGNQAPAVYDTAPGHFGELGYVDEYCGWCGSFLMPHGTLGLQCINMCGLPHGMWVDLQRKLAEAQMRVAEKERAVTDTIEGLLS